MPDAIVQPKTGAAPDPQVAPNAPAPQAQSPEDANGNGIPDVQEGLPPELIKIPAIQGLLAGQPAAVSASLKEFSKQPEAKLISEHKDLLTKAGFGFYKSLSGQQGVLFNEFYIHPQDIQAADKAGKLGVVAPSFNEVNHSLSKMGTNHPIMTAKTPKSKAVASPGVTAPPQMGSGLAAALQPAPAPAAGGGHMPAGTERKLTTARLVNSQAGAPTSGPSPGAGRFVNSVLKNPV